MRALNSKVRILGFGALGAMVLLGLCLAFNRPWLARTGQGLSTTLRSWFLPPTLLVTADLDCQWKLDGKPQGYLRANQTRVLTVVPGQHLVEARTQDGRDGWRGVAEVHAREQRVAAIDLGAVQQKRIAEELALEKDSANQKRAVEEARQRREAARKDQESQAAILDEARRARSAASRAARSAAEAAESAKKASGESAARELRAERRTVNVEHSGMYAGSRAVAESQAIAAAKTELSLQCQIQPSVSQERIRAAYKYGAYVYWALAEYTADRVSCDGRSPGYSFCAVSMRGSCQLSGLP